MVPAVFFGLPRFGHSLGISSLSRFPKKYEVPELVRDGLDFTVRTLHNECHGEIAMSAPTRSIETTKSWPKTMRFCRICSKETPHQIRQGAGVVVTLCIPCLERALTYELDRD